MNKLVLVWKRFVFASLIFLPYVLFAQQEQDSVIRKERFRENRPQQERKKNGGNNGPKLRVDRLSLGNIVMGAPTDHSITASIVLDRNMEYFIEYGMQSGRYTSKTSVDTAQDQQPHEQVLRDLKSNTRYYYRVNYRELGQRSYNVLSESWFSTQRTPSSTFAFGVQGDSHPERAGKMFNADYYKNTLAAASSIKPDFYFLMGDDFSMDRLIQDHTVTTSNVEAIYKVQRYFLGNAGNNPPLFLVNGNHEQAAQYILDGTSDNAAVLAGLTRKKYFPLPDPVGIYSGDKEPVPLVGLLKDYYAFEWGDALFVVIDPYWHSKEAVDNQPGDRQEKSEHKRNPWSATLGEAQYQWFKHTLENSKAKFKFVFAHHVNGTGRGGVERAGLFEWGGYGQNGQWQFDQQRAGWGSPIHQLMVKNKVTIFFQGHDHLYAKQEKDGVVYQSVPNPADDTHTAFNKDAYQSGIVLPNSGHLRVTVTPAAVTVDYIRTYDATKNDLSKEITDPYSYTIKKN